jgi:multicomponent Na+:H+ antiporter subunit D
MVSNSDLLLLGVFAVLFAAVALYSIAIPTGDRHWWPISALVALLVLAGLAVPGELPRVLLLDAASFAAVALVWTRRTPAAQRAARQYFMLLILAVLLIGAGLLLGGNQPVAPAAPLARVVVCLLLAGFALKLALVPFYFWLPEVATAAAPMTTALIVSVVDIAAFAELARLRETAPWIFGTASGVWVGIALLSMFGGALLALAQTDIKRMLAFSTIDDMGYLLLGLVAGPGLGLTGALIGAVSHALLKVLLFGAVGIAERGTGSPLTFARRGLAGSYPVSAAAFIVGALGMIGVPPILGFAGRWRLYLAGAQLGGIGLTVAMMAATGLSLLYYVRAAHHIWLGEAAGSVTRREPPLAAFVLVLLMVLVVVLGLYPAGLTTLLG